MIANQADPLLVSSTLNIFLSEQEEAPAMEAAFPRGSSRSAKSARPWWASDERWWPAYKAGAVASRSQAAAAAAGIPL